MEILIDNEIYELIKICKERNEMEFLYNITKIIAETDSIGEAYSYCNVYTKEMFNNGEKHIVSKEESLRGYKDYYDQYLEECSILIYKEYLKQINII